MTTNSRFGGLRVYEDRKVPCWGCGTWFPLTIAEQKAADDAGVQWPKRCAKCRGSQVDHESTKR
jgi:hypothetical protein